MAKKLDDDTVDVVRADARRLEGAANASGPYPEGTRIARPNRPSRMFKVRLTDEQFAELQRLATEHHLPMSTMARSLLLERLDRERHAS